MVKAISIKTFKGLFNVIIILIFAVPFYWLVVTSVKTLGDSLRLPPTFWVDRPLWENYAVAIEKMQFWRMLKNSLVVTGAILVAQALTVIPAAYAFANFTFKGSKALFAMMLATMMVPAQLIFLPVFLLLSALGLINTYASLILPSAASAFGIFMLRQAFKQVPRSLVEAAKLDGASELQIMTRIMLPMAKPTVVTLGLLTFIGTWNDYFWPLVLTTNESVRTLPVGVAGLRLVEGGVNYPVMMAGNVILVVPVLIAFVFAQKQIIKAFTYVGDK